MSLARPFNTAVLLLFTVSVSLAGDGIVRRDGAELRERTGFSGAVVARPAAGERLLVLETSNEWRRVRTAGGREGWLHELFLEESGAPAARAEAAPLEPRREAAPGATARPFEPPPVEERGAVPAATGPEPSGAEIERLRTELARLSSEHQRLQLEHDSLRRAEDGRRRENGRLAAAERELQERSARRADERDASLRALQTEVERLLAVDEGLARCVDERAAALAALAEDHDAEVAELERSHREELAERGARAERLLAEARTANSQEIAGLQNRLKEEQDRIGARFVEDCTALHERELLRQAENLEADCGQRLAEAAAVHAKELRKASKESGWEEEMEAEVRRRVRERLDDALAETKLRAEGRRRGDRLDHEKALAKREAELEADCQARIEAALVEGLDEACQGRVLTALSAQSEALRGEQRAEIRRLQAEEERRCRAALEFVLQRAAEEAGAADPRRERGPGAGARP